MLPPACSKSLLGKCKLSPPAKRALLAHYSSLDRGAPCPAMSHNLLLPPLLLPPFLRCPTPAAVGEGFPAARPAHRLEAAGPELGPALGCSGAKYGPAPPLGDGTAQLGTAQPGTGRALSAPWSDRCPGGRRWVRSGAARRAARPAFPFLPVRGGEALGVALAAFICELSSRCAGSKLRSREVPPAPRCALGMPRCCCCCCALRSSVPGGGRGGVPRAPRHPVCCPAPPEGRDPTASLRRPRSAPREPSPLLALCLYLA